MMEFTPTPLELIVGLLVLSNLYMLYALLTKDGLSSKNIRSIATVVEEINRDIYYLKKAVEETKKITSSAHGRMSDDEIYQEIERTLYDLTTPLSKNIKKLHDAIETIDARIDARISHLESGVKQISIPTSIHANDDEKIIALFKQGVSLETISKELHLSKAEVEFVLKINKIK